MKLSELVGKEIINLMDGTRLGTVGDADLVIDPQDGAIQYIVLPGRGLGRFFSGHGQFIIPWSAVKKIGAEVVIVELGKSRDNAGEPVT